MALIEYFKTHNIGAIGSDGAFGIANSAGIPPALIDLGLNKLIKNNFFVHIFDEDSGEYGYKIHDDFYEEAIPYFLDESTIDSNIPASDRFVSVSDNQIDTSQAINALDELSEAIRASNDLMATPEDQIQISREINFLKELISQPRIHVVALYDTIKANSTLKWLGEQTISAVVRQAAVKAVENLHALWHFVSSLL